MPRRAEPLLDRFLRRIKAASTYGMPGRCWEWPGRRQQAGYGQLRAWGKSGSVVSVHRLAWEAANGPIPKGLWVLHTCDNPPCCNPAHLYVGTAKDNSRDCTARGRRAKQHRPHTRVRKLTDDQVRAIRADWRPLYVVAGQHGVSEATVSGIRLRRRKARVPDAV